MKGYVRYKPSGIEWIGEIPDHWKVKKLKYLVWTIYEKAENDTNFRISLENIETKTGRLIGLENANSFQGELRKFQKGDVLFNKLRPYLAKVYLADNDGACLGELLILRSKGEYLPKFLFYRVLSYGFVKIVDSSTYGSKMPRASWDDFISQLLIPYPQNEEQTAIANYLAHKTAQIDDLISKKQKLIDLLNEEKTAVINQAMTKGLNPNAPMKDSGIPGLGEIPAHWQVKRLKYVVETRLEYGANEPSDSDNPDDPRYIRITDFDETGNLRDDTFRSLPMEKAKDYLLRENDILFARSGATVGKTFIFKHFRSLACFAGYLIRARPNSNLIMPEFLYFFTKCGAYEDWKKSIFNQATIQNIGADKYNVLDIPLPAKPEQEIIVRHIETNLQRISKIISRIQRESELLQEYRTALISEAVTGKIDVVYKDETMTKKEG